MHPFAKLAIAVGAIGAAVWACVTSGDKPKPGKELPPLLRLVEKVEELERKRARGQAAREEIQAQVARVTTLLQRLEIRADNFVEKLPEGAMSTEQLLANDNAHMRGQVEDLVKQCQALRDRFHALAIHTGMPIDG